LIVLPLINTILLVVLGAIVVGVFAYCAVSGYIRVGRIVSTVGSFTFTITGPIYVLGGTLTNYTALIEFLVVLWFLWVVMIIMGFSQSVAAGAISKWYFRPKKEDRSNISIRRTFFEVFKHSIGSFAVGTILRPIVFVLNVMDYFFKSSYAKAERNPRANGELTKVDSSLSYIAKVCRSINRNAYIEVYKRLI
jgi:hypothetical protein